MLFVQQKTLSYYCKCDDNKTCDHSFGLPKTRTSKLVHTGKTHGCTDGGVDVFPSSTGSRHLTEGNTEKE